MSTCDSAEPSSRNSGLRDGRDPVGRYLAALRPVYPLSRPDRWASASTQDRFHAKEFAAHTPPAGERTDPKPGDCRHPPSPTGQAPGSPGRVSRRRPEQGQAAQRPQDSSRPAAQSPAPLRLSDISPPHSGAVLVPSAHTDTCPLRTRLTLPRRQPVPSGALRASVSAPSITNRTSFTGQDQSRHCGAFVGILEERRGVGEWPNAQGVERVPAIPAERTLRWIPILPTHPGRTRTARHPTYKPGSIAS